jgi:hypothetical protein
VRVYAVKKMGRCSVSDGIITVGSVDVKNREKSDSVTETTTVNMTASGKGANEDTMDSRMSEAEIQQLANEYLTARGLLFFHDEKGRGMGKRHRKGWPDLMVYRANRSYHGLAIELKKSDGTTSKEQDEKMHRLHIEGWFVCVCHSFIQAKNIIDEYLK